MKQTQMKPAHRVALIGVSVALALVLSYLESLIPPFFPVPGIKIGLANLLTVFLLYRLSPYDAAAVSLLRIVLASLLFGSFVSFLYSLAGGVVSFAVMLLLRKSGRFGVTGVSVAGGVSHNFGQVAVAAALMRTKELLFYFPVLTVTGTVAGILIGIAGALAVRKIKKI